MTDEIKYLAWSIALGLICVVIAASFSTLQRGLLWNASNRDVEAKPLIGPGARAWRACSNFLETFPFFAAAVLAVVLTKTNSAHTAEGAELYFWARVVYLPLYIIGIPYLRTLVWAASIVGLLMVLSALW
jgi:uncharacterized MAPEG superfamily protein